MFVFIVNFIMRFLAICVLSLIYLLPSLGLAISKHYCGGEVSSVSFIPFHEHTCGCGDEEMDSDCCKDEFCFIKLDDSQQKTQNVQIPSDELGPAIACNFVDASLSNIFSIKNIVPCFDQHDYGFRQCLYKKYHAYLI